jgi:branched-chain amino acid transport system substrate-binding protein
LWAADVYGYNSAQTLVEVLKRCGDDLTRENVKKQAASLNTTLPMLLPGTDRSAPDETNLAAAI